MQGFVDPTVGGISGHCDIENANVNMLTRMQDVRYYFSYKIMKAAESVFGTVSCLPGCFSAYRRTCVLAVMDDWINATVWGKHGNYADDRSLTNLILLREIWKTGKFMWRKHPVPALSWYAMMWMPIVEPVVMVQALVIAPLQEGTLHPSYVIGVLTITLVWCLHFWITSGRRWWYAGVLFTLSYIFFPTSSFSAGRPTGAS